MLFRDWIPTQDPSRWGTVDEVTREYVKSYFAEREICSVKNMPRLFWLHVDTYADTYNNMLRIQLANSTFDPAVNKYVETLRETTQTGADTHTGSSSSTRTGKEQAQTVHSAPDVSKTVADRRADAYSDNDVTSYNDRERVTTRDGVRELRKTGDGARNYTRDGAGSYEETTHKTDTTSSTARSGKFVTTDQSKAATRNTRADKSAPMSAINLARASGQIGPNGEADAYATVANGALGAQNWDSASAYSEAAQDSGDSKRHEEYYEGDGTTVKTEGAAADNVDRVTYAREQQTGTDITERETYTGYKESDKDTGSESRKHDGGARHELDESTTTTTVAPVTVSRTDAQYNAGVTNEQKQSSVAAEDWYRHTGRDGLTPQEAMAAGLRYLADYPDAVLWFVSKLEPCFIGVLDLDLDLEEY